MAHPEESDWSAAQYLKFHGERTRPVHDLIAQVQPLIRDPNPIIHDLGCGPGNSTQALHEAFPNAKSITGVDSSPDMLRKARATFASLTSTSPSLSSKSREESPQITFLEADLSAYTPSDLPSTSLLFSNAVLHWLRHHTRIPTIVRLFSGLSPGAVLAFQVPDNYTQPSHRLMRAVALSPGKAWSSFFQNARVGDLTAQERPDLDPIEHPVELIDALAPLAEVVVGGGGTSSSAKPNVAIWRTSYMHVLPDAAAIVEWVKGTGLQPYLQRIGDEVAKGEFLKAYEEEVRNVYPVLAKGKEGGQGRGVVLEYPRLFVVAVRGQSAPP